MSEQESTRREKAWLKRLQALLDSQPPGTWVYVDGNSANLMRLGPDGKCVLRGEGVDPDYVIGVVRAPGWDGGDW